MFAFMLLVFSVIGAVFFCVDLWLHEGVSIFKRRRVLRSGMAAPALILSADSLGRSIGRGQGLSSAYSIVYEVLPTDAPPFRARGVEVLTSGEYNANIIGALQTALAGTSATVQVRVDPERKVIVLVRRGGANRLEQEQRAAKRKAQDALLRGGPPG
jgi:hypothetical protein